MPTRTQTLPDNIVVCDCLVSSCAWWPRETTVARRDAGGRDGISMLYAWGAGTSGQLGSSLLEDSFLPRRLAGERERVLLLACGGSHAVAIYEGGGLETWGSPCGGLGEGREQPPLPSPLPMPQLCVSRVTRVAAGWAHSAFLTERGELYTAGEGSFGQLGIGELPAAGCVLRPQRVGGLEAMCVTEVAAGLRHTVISARSRSSGDPGGGDGSGVFHVLAFGANSKGQCGQPCSSGRKFASPTRVPALAFPQDPTLAAGGDSSAAIDAEGRLLLWGRASPDQSNNAPVSPTTPSPLPPPATASDVAWRQVALGWRHCVGLDTAGRVWAWGSNQHGQCGTGDTSAVVGQPLQVAGLVGTQVRSVAAGSEHSLAVSCAGELFVWGWAEHGQLGLGDTANQAAPRRLELPRVSRAWCGSGFSIAEVAA
mmetsp:Transcript_18593/g.48575  ORF Transcript_18593/g.48575 Transcript_18593/m.48575 type:complete len:425 (+) Transcript_18593:248-1522(+)